MKPAMRASNAKSAKKIHGGAKPPPEAKPEAKDGPPPGVSASLVNLYDEGGGGIDPDVIRAERELKRC